MRTVFRIFVAYLISVSLVYGVLPFSFWSSSAGSAVNWTHIQGTSTGNSTPATSIVLTLGAAPTTGNTVWMAVLFYAASGTTLTSVQDSNSNSYTITPNSPSTFDATAGQIWLVYLNNAPANATTTITATFGATYVAAAIWGDEFARGTGTGTFDNDAKALGSTGTAINTPTVSVSGKDVTYCAIAYQFSINSVDSPWTEAGTTHSGSRAGYILNRSSNVAVAMTGSTSGGLWTGVAGSIK